MTRYYFPDGIELDDKWVAPIARYVADNPNWGAKPAQSFSYLITRAVHDAIEAQRPWQAGDWLHLGHTWCLVIDGGVTTNGLATAKTWDHREAKWRTEPFVPGAEWQRSPTSPPDYPTPEPVEPRPFQVGDTVRPVVGPLRGRLEIVTEICDELVGIDHSTVWCDPTDLELVRPADEATTR